MTLPDLTLVTPTPDLVAQVLEWRNHPDVTRWLMRTTVDPERFTQAWLDSVDDPLEAGVVAVLDGRAVATGTLEVRDGMGQDGHEATYERSEGLLGYLVDPAYAGRGIATAVAARAARHRVRRARPAPGHGGLLRRQRGIVDR